MKENYHLLNGLNPTSPMFETDTLVTRPFEYTHMITNTINSK